MNRHGNLRCGVYVRAAVVLLASLVLSNAVAADPNQQDPQWVYRADTRPKVALVFVHGIFGETLSTWGAAPGKKSFFNYVHESPQMRGKADIFAFGFTSNMLSAGSLDVMEASKKLTESLKFNGVMNYDYVVFVAHSMGGLVVLHNLIRDRNENLMSKVPLLVLYGTPMAGAEIANIADKVANNSALADMFGADKSKFLKQLSDDWKGLNRRPTVVCGYETLKTYGVMIVPWTSGNVLCSKAAPPISNSSHITIVKPDRPQHDAVVVLVNALNEYAFDIDSQIEMPDFKAEGDHFSFPFRGPQAEARIVNRGNTRRRYTIAEISDSSLYIVPDDTPKMIEGNEQQKLRLNLLMGARKEYSFVIREDAGRDRKVIVRVTNLEALRRTQAEAVGKMVAAMNVRLADPAVRSEIAMRPANDAFATEQAVGAAYAAIKEHTEGVPENVRWLLTADALAAANLLQFALPALRKAEASAPRTAETVAARTLAARVGAASGETSVFTTTTTPKVEWKQPAASVYWNDSKIDSAQRLASRMQQYPSLKASGLGLEGDVMRQRGLNDAARKAYTNAAAINETPAIRARIDALDKAADAKFDMNKSMGIN